MSRPLSRSRGPLRARPPLRRWVALLALGIGSARGAAAAPALDPQLEPAEVAVIRIAARSLLTLQEVERQPAAGGARPGLIGVRVRALLADGPSRVGLAAQALVLSVRAGEDTPRSRRLEAALREASAAATVRTDTEGAAEWSLALPAGSYTLQARYPGDAQSDAATATLPLALDRPPSRLVLEAPETAPLGGELRVTVALSSGEQALLGPAQVTVRCAEHARTLSLVEGRAALRVLLPRPGVTTAPAPDALVLPSALRGGQQLLLRAEFRGDEDHGPAQSELALLLTTQIAVWLDRPGGDARAAEPPPASAASAGGPRLAIAQGERLVLSGLVRDEEGPLADEPFEILATSQPETGPAPTKAALLGRGATDAFGRLRLTVLLQPRHGPLAPGTATLWARARSRRSWRLAGTSNELSLSVLPVPPHRLAYYLAPLLLTALLLGVGAGYRKRQALRARLRALLTRLRGAAPEAEPTSAPPGEAGVRLTQVNRLRALLPVAPVDRGLDGTVEDAALHRPLAGALIRAVPEGSARATVLDFPPEAAGLWARSDEQGRFTLAGPLPPRARVEITAPGYLSVAFAAAVPHQGELRGVRVALSPIRLELLRRFRAALLPKVLPPEHTPREIVDGLGGAAPAAQLARLLPVLEEGLFSPELCTEETLARADHLLAKLAQPPAQGPKAGAVDPARGRVHVAAVGRDPDR